MSGATADISAPADMRPRVDPELIGHSLKPMEQMIEDICVARFEHTRESPEPADFFALVRRLATKGKARRKEMTL